MIHRDDTVPFGKCQHRFLWWKGSSATCPNDADIFTEAGDYCRRCHDEIERRLLRTVVDLRTAVPERAGRAIARRALAVGQPTNNEGEVAS